LSHYGGYFPKTKGLYTTLNGFLDLEQRSYR
jgi:hypothetical protein